MHTKTNPFMCCLPETHFRPRNIYRLKVRAWRKIFHGKRNQKKAEVVILTSDTIDFKIYHVSRHKEGHHVMIKSIQEEDTKTG